MRNFSSKKFVSALVVIIVALSSLTLFAGLSLADYQSTDVGHFRLSYEAGNSVIHNLTYVNPNYSLAVADSATAEGQPVPSSEIGCNDIYDSVEFSNVTVASANSEDMLLLAAASSADGQSPLVTLTLNSPAKLVVFPPQQKNFLKENGAGVIDEFLSNPVYRVTVSDGYIYYMSNSPSTLTGSGNTIIFHNNTSPNEGPLVVGITPSATIKYSLYKQFDSSSLNPFAYDPNTGAVTGEYLTFNFASGTGVISNFTNMYTNTQIFTSISSTGNGSIGGSSVEPNFPSNDPVAIGNVLYYANHTASYEIQNSISALSQFYLSNGTMTLKVATSLSVAAFNMGQKGMPQNPGHGNNFSDLTDFKHGNEYMIQAAPTVIEFSGSNFSGQLLVHSGNAFVNGNTITISTTGLAYATFVSQPWIMGLNSGIRSQLQFGMQHGLVGGTVVIGSIDTATSNLTTLYDGNLLLDLQDVKQDSVSLQLSSNSTFGTIIALFVPDYIISNTSDLIVNFDGNHISEATDLNTVLNSTSQTEPIYYAASVSGGEVVLLSIPHFSTHNVTISKFAPIAGSNMLQYVSLLAISGILALVSYLVYVRTKDKR